MAPARAGSIHQRQSVPGAALRRGQPRPISQLAVRSALAGHTGLVSIDTGDALFFSFLFANPHFNLTQVTLCWAPAAADRPAMDEVRRALDGCDGLLDGRTYTSVRDTKPG